MGARGLKREWRPLRIYRSRNGRTPDYRYFVDKFLFLSGASIAPAPVVRVCYVDGNLNKTAGFETHLLEYRDLFARVESVQSVCVDRLKDVREGGTHFDASAGRWQQNLRGCRRIWIAY